MLELVAVQQVLTSIGAKPDQDLDGLTILQQDGILPAGLQGKPGRALWVPKTDLHRARTLLERALAIREARLGSDHPTVLGPEQLAAVMAALENP